MESTFAKSRESDAGPVFHPRRNLGVNHALPQNASFAFALEARVSNHAARALARRTSPRNTEKSLLIAHLPVAIAATAGHRSFAFGSARAMTFFTSLVAAHVDFRVRPKNSFFKFQREIFAQISATLRTAAASPPAPAKQIVDPKQVAEDFAEILDGSVVAASSSTTEPGVPVTVVGRTLVAVRQDGVGFAAFLEFFFRLRVIRIAIGMILQSELTICALDFLIAGFADNPQNLVVVAFDVTGQDDLPSSSSI